MSAHGITDPGSARVEPQQVTEWRWQADVYAVDGPDWPGTSRAIAHIWDAALPPLQKLVLLAYADSPRTVAEVSDWTGVHPAEVDWITRVLAGDGWIKHRELPPSILGKPAAGSLRAIVFERDDYTCQHCGTHEDLTVDHIYPRSRGGTDDLDNLQTLCRSCNSRKGARV